MSTFIKRHLHLLIFFFVALSWPPSISGSTVGEKTEYLSSDSTQNAPAINVPSALTISSGGVQTFGPFAVLSVEGHNLSYYWSSQEGGLQALTTEAGHVRYQAPVVSENTTDEIHLWVGSSAGKSSEAVILVTILPTTLGGQEAAGQITGIYNFATANFTLTYSLGATVTKAWILASTNGSTYSIVSTVDPVTVSNRSGSRTVSVAGSGAVSQVYFRLRTQIGTAAVEEGATTNVGYTPAPAAPKTTEIPLAPTLYINGWQTGNTQVYMFWPRVNDSLYQDNVVHYDVEYANNPNFTGSTLVNVGNTAAGLNLYESVSYTATGLLDNSTYYFRVRGVNYAGTGPWSNVDTMLINVQDGPVFASTNPVFPPNGATGITKMPALEVNVSDPEGDPLYTAFEISESPTMAEGARRYFGHGGQQAFLNVTRLDPGEWGANPLKPNTHYYWRAIVQEEGRYLDYYGGTWPTSPIYNFTTENVGGNFSLSNVTYISGQLRPYERVAYRVTVTNNGNERSEPNNINVWYVKNGIDNPFAYNSPGYVPALDPGQSTTTDVVAYFTTSLYTNPNNGITYDNVLLTGPSTLRFKSSPYVIATPQATIDYPINYANQGGPTINWQIRSNTSNKPIAPLGGKFIIATSITDDIQTTRVLFEYRATGAMPWTVLDDYTGNTTYYANFQTMNHSGGTVPSSQNGVDWTFPSSISPTSTLQIRMTAFDDTGATTVVTSDLMTILNGTLLVNAGATEFGLYRVGDQIRFPLSVTKAPGMRITNVNINYWYGPSSAERVFDVVWNSGNLTFSNGAGALPFDAAWSAVDGINIPPVVTVTIPPILGLAAQGGYFKVRVQGQIDGLYFASVEDLTNGTFSITPAELPAPFHSFLNPITPAQPSWPIGSTAQATEIIPIAADWQGDSIIHILYKVANRYLPSGGSSFSYITNFYYVFYDRSTGTATQVLLPSTIEYDDLKVIGNSAHLLLRTGTSVAFATMSGTTMSVPQNVLTMSAQNENSTTPEFCRIGTELYVASSTRNDAGGGGSTTWRSRIQRVLPSVLPYIEQPAYYGRHLDYGSHLNTESGLFSLNSNKSITSQVATWPSNGTMWFSSSTLNFSGARYGYDLGNFFVDLYSSTGVATRWNIKLQNIAVTAFSDATLGVGLGNTSSPPGEEYQRVVVRRNNTTGVEERIKFGDFYESGRNSAVSAGKWVAITSRNLLAIGNMSGDITAPAVSITTTDASFVTGQSKVLAWTMSDNLNQLASVKIVKIAGGVTTVMGNYTSGTLPTSLNYTFADTVPSLILRVEAYDQSGNRGVAEKVLTRTSTFTLASFTAASYSVPVATAASLAWTATPAEAFRVYNILTRPQGTTAWNTAGSVTGAAFLLDTTLLSGTQEVRLESGGVTRDLPQPITITGNRFAFDNAGFAPASGTTGFVAAAAPLQTLMWASNQPVSLAVAYTLLGRWDGAGSYVVLGGTGEKSLTVNVGSHTSIEWKVVAQWDGQEFVSSVRTLTLATVAGGPTPVATAGGQTTVSPWVDLTWAAVPGATAMMVYRKDTRTDAVEELARVAAGATSYRDAAVAYGDTFSYTLATVLGDVVSLQGAAASATLTPLLPLGITFINADYQIVPGNSLTAQWNPVRPAGAPAVFEDYSVLLRRGDGSIVSKQTVLPIAGATAEAAYTGLEYNQSYVVEVFALNTNGEQIGAVPIRLHFSTGFDSRTIPAAAIVATPVADFYGVNLSWSALATADYYDIFRRTNGGALTWVGRSLSTGFADGSVPPKASVAYVVRGRNDNTYADSALTAAVSFGAPENFRITSTARTGSGGTVLEIRFNSETGVSYRLQKSSALDDGQWSDAGVGATGNGSVQTLTVSTSGLGGRYFFRVVKL